jgi:hypothetical protein
MSSNIVVKKVCEQCGKIFTAKTTVTRYCSKTCNSRSYKQKIRGEKVSVADQQVREVISHQLQELATLQFLSVKDASKLLGASEKVIHHMIKIGRLKQQICRYEQRELTERTLTGCLIVQCNRAWVCLIAQICQNAAI